MPAGGELDDASFCGAAQPAIRSRRTTMPEAQLLTTIFTGRSLEPAAALRTD